ncbi:MAG: 4Fe-4S dicluster domain-containing protein [Spirochaetes bacterium]|nr:4Fe-4S dicluster domain-containing protein [Spirochaetota bacterium]
MRNFQKHLSKISTPYILAYTRRCKACWQCINACPSQVIGKVDFLWHKHIIIKKGENCKGCKKCIKTCPKGVFFETNKSNE